MNNNNINYGDELEYLGKTDRTYTNGRRYKIFALGGDKDLACGGVVNINDVLIRDDTNYPMYIATSAYEDHYYTGLEFNTTYCRRWRFISKASANTDVQDMTLTVTKQNAQESIDLIKKAFNL